MYSGCVWWVDDKQQGKIGLLSFWSVKRWVSQTWEACQPVMCVLVGQWQVMLELELQNFAVSASFVHSKHQLQTQPCWYWPQDILPEQISFKNMRGLSTCGLCYCASVTIDAWASKDIRNIQSECQTNLSLEYSAPDCFSQMSSGRGRWGKLWDEPCLELSTINCQPINA